MDRIDRKTIEPTSLSINSEKESQASSRHDGRSDDLSQTYLVDEEELIQKYRSNLADSISADELEQIKNCSSQLIKGIKLDNKSIGIENFLSHYQLSSHEGLALMCLAEAMIRIPDSATKDAFLQDIFHDTHWENYLKKDQALWVNASTWGLIFTGSHFKQLSPKALFKSIRSLAYKISTPVFHQALKQAIGLLGEQFIFAKNIGSGIALAKNNALFSFDMLGEAAIGFSDSEVFFNKYRHAIQQLSRQAKASKHETDQRSKMNNHGISIKLSALHPRFEIHHSKNCVPEIVKNILILVEEAKYKNIPLTIDAEESFRLELTLNVFKSVFTHSLLKDWPYFGIAIQAYQKRAHSALSYLLTLSKTENKKIPIRLVKGAYWDSEIKYAQQKALENYPVFTKKTHTDIAYLYCANFLFENIQHFYPQFASHNANSIAYILNLSYRFNTTEFEFQKLYGMGNTLYKIFEDHLTINPHKIPYRVYAPIGEHQELLPYLVRRLLENGANTSFVNALNSGADISSLVENPVDQFEVLNQSETYKTKIPFPKDLTLNEKWSASVSINLDNAALLDHAFNSLDLNDEKNTAELSKHKALKPKGKILSIINPANHEQQLGYVNLINKKACRDISHRNQSYMSIWKKTLPIDRARYINDAAKKIEGHRDILSYLLVKEAGKTLINAQNEIKEAADFCRYYASQMIQHFNKTQALSNTTGESNLLSYEPKGQFLCISPWNFPLAIFTGQIAAALLTGNCVLAKPALQTPLIAKTIVDLFYQAGIPEDALQLIIASDQTITQSLLCDSNLDGLAFTGSYQSARFINLQLAKRESPLASFIAETGGQNAMIVDSTALPEQVVLDACQSAFDSAGQRCSALRVLFIQEEVFDQYCELISAHVKTLVTGDPSVRETDVGPIIDEKSFLKLQAHIDHLNTYHLSNDNILENQSTNTANNNRDPLSSLKSRLIVCGHIDQAVRSAGYFITPHVFEISNIEQLSQEHFGPILHLIRYSADTLEETIASINQLKYGLTLGIHTRIQNKALDLAQKVNVGNVYINRDIIGASVGMQAFGGRGLSGTGFKAGGPNYLLKFMNEKLVCTNTTAIGGNTELLTK